MQIEGYKLNTKYGTIPRFQTKFAKKTNLYLKLGDLELLTVNSVLREK